MQDFLSRGGGGSLKARGGISQLGFEPGGPRLVLCLGAHCDDIEIGCGGTLLRLQDEFPDAEFVWIAFSGDEERERETRNAAALIHPVSKLRVETKRFTGSYLPYEGGAVKNCFEELKREFQPDLIFTHFLGDRHQDHRLLSELTWNTFRNHFILEYEIPKYEGDLAHPNVFMPLSGAIVDRKIDIIEKSFPSQRSHSWFSAETFRSLMRLRGVECNAESGYAEAFHCRKVVL